MRFRDVFIALLLLCILAQHTRLLQVEGQLAVLTDTVQRQGLKLQELEKPAQEEPEQKYEDIARKVFGYFDDHDVSGLLEDW